MKRIIIVISAVLLCNGCALYKSFEVPEGSVKNDVVGDVVDAEGKVVADTLISESPVDLPSWREFFGDAKLQNLIEKGLEANSDLQIARMKIEDSKTMLLTSKLAYLPSIGVNGASVSTSSFGGNSTGTAYNLPISASWEIDLFGKIRNSKERAKANLLMSEEYLRLTELEITTLIANSYYTLIMLDEQLAVAEEFIANQTNTLEAMRQLKAVGLQSEAAVSQAEASLYNTCTTKSDLELKISLVENAVSLLINEPAHSIERASYAECDVLGGGLKESISLEVLSNRPDVKASEYALRSSFYGANVARAAMYPSLSLSGSIGWTNNFGGIVNPGNLLMSALGSLTAPIFNKGVNRANLNVAKSEYEQALVRFEKSLLSAGNEVNGLLVEKEKIAEKRAFRQQQIASNQKAYDNTQLLMKYSTATYLEVLVAQTSLLNSRLTDVGEWMVESQSAINLYKALGGSPQQPTEE